ncbi:MAG: hypothetical protein KIT36_10965 [Alphaproteobacteria bacterium]|nr:hypothetical protein [Alphaproteobacteria bacterium]
MFPDDDRVVALFAEARRKFGDDALRDPRRSIPLLADRAPELRDTIKATAAALSMGAPQRLRAAPDQASEFHRLAIEITGREGVAAADAMAGVRIAARLGGQDAAGMPPQDRSWVGGTVLPGGAGAPGYGGGPLPPAGGPNFAGPGGAAPNFGSPGMPPPTAASAGLKWGGWGAAALVGVGILAVVGLSSGPEKGGGQGPPPQQPQAGPPPQQPQSGPPPQQPQGGPPPQQSGGLPIIVPPDSGRQPPAIAVRDAGQMYVLEFGANGGNQTFRMMVGISKQQGWGSGVVLIASQSASQPENVSQPGPFALNSQGGNAIRVLQPQWQRDGLNIGAICVAFVQPRAQDVQLRGSNVCVLASNCNQMVGCGVVQ